MNLSRERCKYIRKSEWLSIKFNFVYLILVSEEDMLASMITYLEEENKTELSSILQVSKFVYSPQWEFSGIVS